MIEMIRYKAEPEGIRINADVNAAYQIMKKAGYDPVCHDRIQEVRKIKVA